MFQKFTKPRYAYIDALRGWAILAIVFFHTSSFTAITYPSWFAQISAQGARGVQLFFILSAISLCFSYSRYSFKYFYIQRFIRIAPLFYMAILYYLWQNNWHNSLISTISSFTFTNGFSPYLINDIFPGSWFIPVEVTFILLFPFLFKHINGLKKALLWTGLSMIISQLIRLWLLGLPLTIDANTWQEFTFLFAPSQLPVFISGILAYFLINKTLTLKEKYQVIFGIIILILVLVIQTIFHLKIIAGHYLWSLLFLGLTYFLSKKPLFILVNQITQTLGRRSFEIYLCHIGILYWISHLHWAETNPSNLLPSYLFRYLLLMLLSLFFVTVGHYLHNPIKNISHDHYPSDSNAKKTS